ncbi:MAG TPA: glycine--tRNA ligase [Verrucomicrobia subdivision 3 bacterium]|nr:glycine--tRNA ligase [Limisphaerales bacterium]
MPNAPFNTVNSVFVSWLPAFVIDFCAQLTTLTNPMAEPKENLQMEKIVSLCKRRGFVFQSSEIYGGINGFWDYGPLGAELKRNVKELWWHAMTRQRDDVAGLEATIIMSPQIWKASGHVDTFADLMRECPLTKKRVRADQVEPQSGIVVRFSGIYNCKENSTRISKVVEQSAQTIKTKQAIEELFKKNITDGEVREMDPEKYDHANGPDQIVALREAAQKHYADCAHFQSFSILLQPGKPLDSARKVANQYYFEKTHSDAFILLGESSEKVENSTDFHPESGVELTEARPFNLMFKTYVGPVESEDGIAYLRPETAQAIFAQFKNVLETSRQKVPFGIAQVGKAFRNEVTPRNFTFRSREFEQMELEFFIKPDEVIEAIHGSVAKASEISNSQSEISEPQPNWGWEAWHKYWVEERVRFYEGIGLSRETLGFHHQTPAELAHYARACTDILFKFPFSKKDADGNVTGDELEGIAARSDFDLSQHQRFSGKPMGVFDDELRAAWGKLPKEKQDDLWKRYYDNRKNYLTKSAKPDETAEQIQKQATEDANGLAKGQYIPHVIEPSAGVDRLILALIANAYSEITETDDKGKTETRVTMKFHPRVAPIKVGVLPLLKNKPELVKKAQEVRDLLRPWMNVFYDEAGSIGRRYARQDEAGTPFCLTIDFDTLGEKPELLDTVTIRYRDDGKQERLKISELRDWLLARIR